MVRSVGIVIFDDVEVLDFCGPFEVFSVTRDERLEADDKPFTAYLLAAEERLIRTRGGMLVQPHYTLVACPPLDILLVPGGWGTRREVGNQQLIGWLRERSRQVELTTSVCTGSFLLAEAGLLDGLRATTHWQSIERMAAAYPNVAVLAGQRFVDNGRVITSAGISAGIDMSLHIVSRLLGAAVAVETARSMEYDWRPSLAGEAAG